jgi:hypothetical protein
MVNFAPLIDQLCAKRSALAQTMAARPEQVTEEQIRDLAVLQTALLALETEKRLSERESYLEHAVDHVAGP